MLHYCASQEEHYQTLLNEFGYTSVQLKVWPHRFESGAEIFLKAITA